MDHETTEEIKRYLDVTAANLRGELKADIREVREDLRVEIQGVREDLRVEIHEVKRHSDVVAESLRSEIRLVAEGVAGLDEKFTQEFVNVRTEIREQIGDVKSLLEASYRDLDRRERKPS
jgi:archaellum component FlaC